MVCACIRYFSSVLWSCSYLSILLGVRNLMSTSGTTRSKAQCLYVWIKNVDKLHKNLDSYLHHSERIKKLGILSVTWNKIRNLLWKFSWKQPSEKYNKVHASVKLAFLLYVLSSCKFISRNICQVRENSWSFPPSTLWKLQKLLPPKRNFVKSTI